MDDIIDIVAITTFTAYGVHSQCMLDNLAQHRKLRSLPWVTVNQLDWHKVGSVGGRSTNHRSRNWRSKMHGKTKHSWSTINSEHQVDQRSVNRRSNLIWLAMEKPALSQFTLQDHGYGGKALRCVVAYVPAFYSLCPRMEGWPGW